MNWTGLHQRISTLVGAIAPSATLAIDAKARALRASGVKVVSFGAGEPDFPTPDYIVEAAVEAARAAGVAPLHRRRRAPAAAGGGGGQDGPGLRLRGDAGQVLITNGGKQAIANAFLTCSTPATR